MISGVLFCIVVLYPQISTCLPLSNTRHLQDHPSTNIQLLNSGTPSKLLEGLISTHQPSQRLFHAHHHMFSLNKLSNLKNIITLSQRTMDFASVALREYNKSGLFSASEQLMNNAKGVQLTLTTYDEILSTLLSIVCSAENGLQTIEMSVRYRGDLYGLEKEASRVERHFQTASSQLKSLQTIISAVHDRGNSQCRFSSTPMIPIQEYLNFNIVKETKQIIQNLTSFVDALKHTMNDCQTVEILSTFLSRAANLMPGIRNAKIDHPEAVYVFNESIRYQWNDTEQRLCNILREIHAVKTLMEIQNSGTEDTQTLDDVIYNIQNSLSALGTVNFCTGKSSSPVRVTTIENHSQNALMNLNEILLKLDSYKESKFCTH